MLHILHLHTSRTNNIFLKKERHQPIESWCDRHDRNIHNTRFHQLCCGFIENERKMSATSEELLYQLNNLTARRFDISANAPVTQKKRQLDQIQIQ